MLKISMEFISEYPIARMGRRNIAGLKIVTYFIYLFGMIGPTMLTCLETNNRSIMALIHVFVEVLDSANRDIDFDIDMSIVLKQKDMDCMVLPNGCLALYLLLLQFVNCLYVGIMDNHVGGRGCFREFLRKLFRTWTTSHANSCFLSYTTWTVYHATFNYSM